MSIELVRNALQAHGLADRIIEFSVSSATVALAAATLLLVPFAAAFLRNILILLL